MYRIYIKPCDAECANTPQCHLTYSPWDDNFISARHYFNITERYSQNPQINNSATDRLKNIINNDEEQVVIDVYSYELDNRV